jgi:uncharacterized damage-inducible protein DinB
VNAKDAIKHALNANHWVLTSYLADLSDADLLVRPVPGANHIAWQLGHLIAAEGVMFMQQIPGAKPVELPAGFADQHGKDTSSSDSPTGWKSKAEYLELFGKVRKALIEALDQLPDADLEKATTGRVATIAPTVGALLLLAANHEMMHAGQFTVIRRKLGKPVLF